MVSKKGWVLFPVLLAGLGLAALSCSSESDKTSRPAETAKPATPPGAPGAPEAPGAKAPESPAATAQKEAAGEVVSVNPTMKTLVVKSGGGEMTFEVKESAAGDLSNLKPGDKVTVKYSEAGGKMTAETIQKG